MDHIIATAGLRLSYLRDPSSIGKLNAQTILDDLTEVETRYPLSAWFARVTLTDFDHVVLATDRETGRHVALLAANDGDTPHGPYLNLRAALVIDAIRSSKLMRRLLAYMVSRISCLGAMPRIIAAQTSIPSCYRLLSLFAQAIPGAAIFPEPDALAIDLALAALARQIARRTAPHLEYEAGTGTIKGARLTSATCFARAPDADPVVNTMFDRNLGSGDQMMVVVDLRSCDEAVIDAETRDLIRSRWKIPFLAMQSITPRAAATANHRTPTLTA
jgi:hypothetical protein